MSFGQRFLRHPDLFPARTAGSAWGGESLVVGSPGGPYAFTGLSDRQAEELGRRFGPLSLSGARPRVESRLLRVAAEEFLPPPRGPWEYVLDLDYEPRAVRVVGLDLMARVEWRPGLGGALWVPAEGAGFLGCYENFFRVLTAYSLQEAGGALLHAAGVAVEGGVALFYGRSGAGKSTLSRLALAAAREVLSDDLNAVTPAEGSWQVEKVPFAGDLGQDARRADPRPLRCLCRLRKGESVAARPMGTAEALASLVACSPFVNADPVRGARLVERWQKVTAAVRVIELTFARSSGFEEVEAVLPSMR